MTQLAGTMWLATTYRMPPPRHFQPLFTVPKCTAQQHANQLLSIAHNWQGSKGPVGHVELWPKVPDKLQAIKQTEDEVPSSR